MLENDGLIEATGNHILDHAGIGGTFVNRSTFLKSGGGSNSTIDVLLDLDGGTVQADNGTIVLTRGAIFTNGTLTAAASANVDLESGTFEISGVLGGDPEGVVRTSSAAILRPLDGVSGALGFGGVGLAWEAGTIQGPGRIVNSGLLEAKGGLIKLVTGILENNDTLLWSNGNINLDGGLLENDGLIEATGNHILDFAGLGGTFVNRATFLKSGGGSNSTIDVDIVQESGSELAVDNGNLVLARTTDHQAGAILTGDGGKLDITGTLVNQGITAPGGEPGNLRWSGTWAPTASGELAVDLGGLTPVVEHDQLQITGAAVLDGMVRVALINGFTPQLGDAFTVMTCSGGCGGSFDGVIAPPGFSFDVVVNANDVQLVAGEPPTGPQLDITGSCPGPTAIDISRRIARWRVGDPALRVGRLLHRPRRRLRRHRARPRRPATRQRRQPPTATESSDST